MNEAAKSKASVLVSRSETRLQETIRRSMGLKITSPSSGS